jgi:hypothetical protein
MDRSSLATTLPAQALSTPSHQIRPRLLTSNGIICSKEETFVSNQWTVLIVAIVVLVVLVAFRDRLRDFSMKASHKGLNVRLQGQPRQPSAADAGASVKIQGNRQLGWMHKIFAGRPAIISDNVQTGANNQMEARLDPVGTQVPDSRLPGLARKRQNRGHADR